MIFSRMFLRLVMMIIGFAVCLPVVQAMNMELEDTVEFNGNVQLGDDQEVSCLIKTLQCLKLTDAPIKMSNGDKLFVERYVDLTLTQDFTSFNNLDEAEKTELMNKVFNLVHCFRYSPYTIDVVKNALELANQSLERNQHSPIRWKQIEPKDEDNEEELALRNNNDEDEQLDDQEEEMLIEKVEEIPLEIIIETAVEAALACKRIIRESGNQDELLYADILKKITERKALGDSCAKALFIECLNRCDEVFKNRGQGFKNSLSMMDLKGEWSRVCGHEWSNVQKFFMALSGAEEPSLDAFAKGFCILLIAAMVAWVVCTVGATLYGGIIASSSDNGRNERLGNFFIPGLVIPVCIAAVVVVLGMGKNCVHYGMTKNI